jgi:hypothetical protein
MTKYNLWLVMQANAQPTGERLPTDRWKEFEERERRATIEREWEEREYQDALKAVQNG